MDANAQPTLRVQITNPTTFSIYLNGVPVLIASRLDADVTVPATVIVGRIGDESHPAQTEPGA